MTSRKYRGIEIDSAHIDMAKNLDSVDELIDELRDLQANWNNLSLLGELTNVGAEISSTRQHFQRLASDLTNFLIEQSTRQAVEQLATRAQNSIDILVRNLYERTADIGFLATDPVFTQRCVEAAYNPLTEDALEQTRQRMRNYVAKYSVYGNVILLDANALVITDMRETLPPGTAIQWIRREVAASPQYAEAFRPLRDDSLDGNKSLIYAWKIELGGQIKGYIALDFSLNEESDALFSKVMGKSAREDAAEWRVCGVTNQNGDVLISSNPQYIGTNQTIRLPQQSTWGVTQVGPMAYLVCIRSTRGYQGYTGPGWRGFCMVPLNHAFDHSNLTEDCQVPELLQSSGLIDTRIQGFENQAAEIQKQLNRSIWNGNMTQRNSTSALGNSFSKTLLWEIGRAGESTKTLFTQSLEKLVRSEINGFQTEQQARAMLAMDLMDRNLYERANDCRWWALTPVLAQALTDPQAIGEALECLKHIQSLYTVYTNIVLLNRDGQIVCDSAEQVQADSMPLDTHWLKQTLQLKNQAHYCVSAFEPTALYQNRPTYIYSAAIFENPDSPSQAIGAIALVFDSEPQFEAILNESMGDSRHKAFAYIVDDKRNVISSTTHLYIDQGKLTLPLPIDSKFQKQKADLGYFELNGRLIAYGVCNSGAYREYKNAADCYQNDLQCVYGLDIGALKPETNEKAGEISFDEFRQADQKELRVDIASFRVGGHWYGIDSEDAVEAFLCREVVTMPNSPAWIAGTTLYKKEAITIVDISKVLAADSAEHHAASQRQQMILLKTGGSQAKIALVVDELGEIPSLPVTALNESENLTTQGNIIQALVKTSNNLLVVLNTEQLLKQLEQGIKKAPQRTKGLFPEALAR